MTETFCNFSLSSCEQENPEQKIPNITLKNEMLDFKHRSLQP